MKRILLPAVVFLALAVPMQTASADEKICQSGGFMTQKCLNHMQKIADAGDDVVFCNRQFTAEYKGDTGFGEGKGPRYIKKQLECLKLNQKLMDLMKDAYVPGGDTSVRRQLRKNNKKIKALIEKAKAEMAKE